MIGEITDPEVQYRAALSNLEEALTGLELTARSIKHPSHTHAPNDKSIKIAEEEARILVRWIGEAIEYKVASLRLDILREIHAIAEA